jgi:hypothetical protein
MKEMKEVKKKRKRRSIGRVIYNLINNYFVLIGVIQNNNTRSERIKEGRIERENIRNSRRIKILKDIEKKLNLYREEYKKEYHPKKCLKIDYKKGLELYKFNYKFIYSIMHRILIIINIILIILIIQIKSLEYIEDMKEHWNLFLPAGILYGYCCKLIVKRGRITGLKKLIIYIILYIIIQNFQIIVYMRFPTQNILGIIIIIYLILYIINKFYHKLVFKYKERD